jgi:hypothetical protein
LGRPAEIDAEEAARIKAETGEDLTGWKRSIIATEVRKILRDHSADPRPVTAEDFEKLPVWFAKAERRQKIGAHAARRVERKPAV